MTLLRTHWLTFLLAITVGAVAVGPYFYFAFTPQYKGIALLGQDAEEHYVARMQEVYDGHPLIGNVFLPYKDTPYLLPGLGENIVASTGRVIFLSATQVNIVSKFVFPFFGFLLMYTLGFTMTRSRLAGLLAATLVMFANDLMSYPRDLLQMLHGTSLNDGIFWARPINPEVSGLFLFGALFLIYHYYCTRTSLRWWQPVMLGLLVGLLLYISPFPWLFLGVLLIVLLGWLLWQRRYTEARSIFAAGVIALLCAVPFVINYLQYKNYPGYTNAALQTGALHSHAPVFGIWVFVLLLVPLFIWPKEMQQARLFFIASAIALLVVLNQQILTGFYLQPGHFHWYITKPLVGVMLGVYAVWFLQKHVSKAWCISITGVVMLVLFMHAAFVQVHFYKLHAPQSVAAQGYAPALAYLNTLPRQTVFADPALSDYIAMYTADDAPNDVYAGLYIAPKEYFEQRLFLEYRVRGIQPKDALVHIQKEQPAILQSLYGIYYEQALQQLQLSPDAIITSLADKYAAQYAQSIPSLMQQLGIAMLMQDKTGDLWSTAALAGLQSTMIDNRFTVYSIR